MTVLWLIRHAATNENLQYRMIGQTDVPLGTVGLQQATALGQRLRDVPFEAIYSSPLARAVETAWAITARRPSGLALHIRHELQELHLGIFEGVSSFDAYETHRDLIDEALNPSTDDFAFPGGELRSAAVHRMHQLVCDIVALHPHAEIGLVTHGAVIGCWLSSLHQAPLGAYRTYQPKHASVTKVLATVPETNSDVERQRVNGRASHQQGVQPVRPTSTPVPTFKLQSFNDISHLCAAK